MKLIDLLRLSNARFYTLEIYGSKGQLISLSIDIERSGDKLLLSKYAQAEVASIQPIAIIDGAELEVQLYV